MDLLWRQESEYQELVDFLGALESLRAEEEAGLEVLLEQHRFVLDVLALQ